jgi:hypothetical protein
VVLHVILLMLLYKCMHVILLMLLYKMRNISCKQSSVADPWHFGVDPDPAIFLIDFQDAKQKTNFFKKVFMLITV